MRNFNIYLKTIHPLGIFLMLVPMFFTLVKPIIYVYMLRAPNWLLDKPLALQVNFAVSVLIGVFINIHMSNHVSKQKINPLAAALAVLWFVTDAILTMLALATLDIGEWGTREVAPQQKS